MKIAILTSGGDAPGMNAAVLDLYFLLKDKQQEVVLVKNGFKGLVENEFYELKESDMYHHDRSGSFIGSSRYIEFLEAKNQIKAINNLKKHQINRVIVIGGNGSFKGAQVLNSAGIKISFIPATIDKDLDYETYSLGFDSALNEAVNAIRKIRHTFRSHNAVCFVEVMGRRQFDLTLNAARSGMVDIVLNCTDPNVCSESVFDEIKKRYEDLNYCIILALEKTINEAQKTILMQRVEKEINKVVRWNVLGYTQRGADPTAFDLNFAYEASKYVSEHLHENFSVITYDSAFSSKFIAKNNAAITERETINSINNVSFKIK